MHFGDDVIALSVVLRFLFMMNQPPGTTLFPYTTLFRSHFNLGWLSLDDSQPAAAARHFSAAARIVPDKGGVYFGLGIDRKSTRLNSSHVRNSYAVFCLKKNKSSSQSNH